MCTVSYVLLSFPRDTLCSILKAPPPYKHIEDGHLTIGEQLPTVHNQHDVTENIQVLKLDE